MSEEEVEPVDVTGCDEDLWWSGNECSHAQLGELFVHGEIWTHLDDGFCPRRDCYSEDDCIGDTVCALPLQGGYISIDGCYLEADMTCACDIFSVDTTDWKACLPYQDEPTAEHCGVVDLSCEEVEAKLQLYTKVISIGVELGDDAAVMVEQVEACRSHVVARLQDC